MGNVGIAQEPTGDGESAGRGNTFGQESSDLPRCLTGTEQGIVQRRKPHEQKKRIHQQAFPGDHDTRKLLLLLPFPAPSANDSRTCESGFHSISRVWSLFSEYEMVPRLPYLPKDRGYDFQIRKRCSIVSGTSSLHSVRNGSERGQASISFLSFFHGD
ncbi:hypothetical protein NL676_012003 [Syzygium grande]|nr:hypothetical protein NL676_012003 [Syzygium grande]